MNSSLKDHETAVMFSIQPSTVLFPMTVCQRAWCCRVIQHYRPLWQLIEITYFGMAAWKLAPSWWLWMLWINGRLNSFSLVPAPATNRNTNKVFCDLCVFVKKALFHKLCCLTQRTQTGSLFEYLFSLDKNNSCATASSFPPVIMTSFTRAIRIHYNPDSVQIKSSFTRRIPIQLLLYTVEPGFFVCI